VSFFAFKLFDPASDFRNFVIRLFKPRQRFPLQDMIGTEAAQGFCRPQFRVLQFLAQTFQFSALFGRQGGGTHRLNIGRAIARR